MSVFPDQIDDSTDRKNAMYIIYESNLLVKYYE